MSKRAWWAIALLSLCIIILIIPVWIAVNFLLAMAGR
jgi:hypothetical protein